MYNLADVEYQLLPLCIWWCTGLNSELVHVHKDVYYDYSLGKKFSWTKQQQHTMLCQSVICLLAGLEPMTMRFLAKILTTTP